MQQDSDFVTKKLLFLCSNSPSISKASRIQRFLEFSYVLVPFNEFDWKPYFDEYAEYIKYYEKLN